MYTAKGQSCWGGGPVRGRSSESRGGATVKVMAQAQSVEGSSGSE